MIYNILYIILSCRLQRFEKTNEMLTNCNALSASRLKTVAPEFKKHTQQLVDMKKDLDYIFKKIRTLKLKLGNQYPTQFAEAQRSSLAEECEEDEDYSAHEKERRESIETKKSVEKEELASKSDDDEATDDQPDLK